MVNLDTVIDLHPTLALGLMRQAQQLKRSGMSGLGADINFDALFSKGLDVAGSLLARKPSDYVSPNDPRYRAQPPQNVYMVPPAPAANTAPMVPKKDKEGLGVKVDQQTLLLAAGALLIFMVASKR